MHTKPAPIGAGFTHSVRQFFRDAGKPLHIRVGNEFGAPHTDDEVRYGGKLHAVHVFCQLSGLWQTISIQQQLFGPGQ